MLPAVAELVPPFAADDFVGVDLVNSPEIFVRSVEEDRLEDVIFVRHGRFGSIVVLTELVLVVGAVEGHFDLLHVFGVGVRVVHWAEACGLAVDAGLFVFGEGDLVLLLLVLGFGAQLGIEVGFVVRIEVVRVRVCDCDIVVKFGAAENKLLPPSRCAAEEIFGVVSEDAEDEVVVGFGGGGRAGVAASAFATFGVSGAFLRVEGGGFEDDTGFAEAGFDGRDVGVSANGHALGTEVGGPVGVKGLEFGEGDHLGKIWEKGFWVIVPKLHIRVVEKAFENRARDISSLIAWEHTLVERNHIEEWQAYLCLRTALSMDTPSCLRNPC